MKKRLSVKLIKFIIKDWIKFYKRLNYTVEPTDDLFPKYEQFNKGFREGQIEALENILYILNNTNEPLFKEVYFKEKPSKENPN